MSTLKNRAIQGTIWTSIGFGAAQATRLVSNLLLTRLLFPEVFGLSALITSFLIGLQMFSDVGIGPSLIQNDRGDDPVFLNTAWTIQVFRGFALWLCACIGAWPFANFYGEPQLGWLVTISGLTALISGFNSTGLFTANRHLKLGRLTLIELGTQLISVGATIIWAFLSPTVWAIVFGGIIGACLKMLASHLWLSEVRHRFSWDCQSRKTLFRFGRWIFISTILGFFINHGDRVILGKFLTLRELGIYSIGSMLAKVVEQAYQQISNKILFPVFSQIKHLEIKELRKKVVKVRQAILITFLPPLWFFVLFGDKLVNFLFDPRYHEAGWIFQVLSAGLIPVIINGVGPFYLAFGKSKLFMYIVILTAFNYFSAIIAGYWIYGARGVIIGIAAHNLLNYGIHVYAQRKFSIWIPGLDALGISTSILVIGSGYFLWG